MFLSKWRSVFMSVRSVFSYVLLLAVGGVINHFWPTGMFWQGLWGGSIEWWLLRISWPGLVLAVVGLVIYVMAARQSSAGFQLKSAAEDRVTRAAARLETTGIYARLRHPMYGGWYLGSIAVGLAWSSLAGFILVLLLTALYNTNTFYEEHHVLLPQFGDAYRDYMERVPHRLLTTRGVWLASSAVILMLAGLGWRVWAC